MAEDASAPSVRPRPRGERARFMEAIRRNQDEQDEQRRALEEARSAAENPRSIITTWKGKPAVMVPPNNHRVDKPPAPLDLEQNMRRVRRDNNIPDNIYCTNDVVRAAVKATAAARGRLQRILLHEWEHPDQDVTDAKSKYEHLANYDHQVERQRRRLQ